VSPGRRPRVLAGGPPAGGYGPYNPVVYPVFTAQALPPGARCPRKRASHYSSCEALCYVCSMPRTTRRHPYTVLERSSRTTRTPRYSPSLPTSPLLLQTTTPTVLSAVHSLDLGRVQLVASLTSLLSAHIRQFVALYAQDFHPQDLASLVNDSISDINVAVVELVGDINDHIVRCLAESTDDDSVVDPVLLESEPSDDEDLVSVASAVTALSSSTASSIVE